MSDEFLVKVEGVSKKFCRRLKRSLWYGVRDIGTELIGRAKKPELRKGEFWAVNDVSFELRRGECLGLIGHNGAGKSTLLKMLNGLIKPDKGRITMQGRIGALIELGTGFNPILTGRENIYNNGAVLGFTKREIDQKFDSIVGFSEMEDFIDTPVQNYSSGMKVRLGFAVAAHMDPDVLLVDEVLAVGDLNFKLKCFNLIDQIVEHCAVIFVSHSMQLVSRLCNQILMMEGGCEKYLGTDVSEGIDKYYSSLSGTRTDFIRSDSEIKLLKVTVNNSEEDMPLIKRLDDLLITLHVEIDNKFEQAVSSIALFDYEQKAIGICMNEEPLNRVGEILNRRNGKSSIALNVKIPRINLSKGIYYITFSMAESIGSKPIAHLNNIKAFQVTSKHDVWPPLELESDWHLVNL
ncbi:MAG: ABC transporter ATP-binding protein [Lentimicrobiaceae bacterium]|nr:ABC transporter ATP-binding protein [Lentimicrobiaceae bacterium]